VTYEKNKGKGFAVAQGLKIAKGEIVVLLDADITDYSKTHILKLCKPLTTDKLRFTIGICSNFKEITILKSVSGLRAYFKEDLISMVEELEKSSKYGIEPILNMKLKHLKHDYVKIPKINHIYKFQKHPPQKMLKEYALEGKSLAKESFRILMETEL
jgi:glycosyltransferase involved in cell wall biosynthesis